MFTAADVKNVILYNKTGNIFRIAADGRVIWDLRNGDVSKLNTILSSPLVSAADLSQLKKQVRSAL